MIFKKCDEIESDVQAHFMRVGIEWVVFSFHSIYEVEAQEEAAEKVAAEALRKLARWLPAIRYFVFNCHSSLLKRMRKLIPQGQYLIIFWFLL